MSLVSQLDSFGEWTDYSVFIEMKPRSDLASLFVDVPPGFREKENVAEGEGRASGDSAPRKVKYEDINVINVTETKICIGAPPTAETLHKHHKEASDAQSRPVPINNSKKNQDRSTSGSDKGSNSCSPKSAPSTPTKKSGKKKNQQQNGTVTPQKFDRYGATLKCATINTKSLSSPTWSDASPRLFMCKVQIEPDNLPLVQKTLHRLAVDICKQEKLEEFAQRAHPRLKCTKCQMELLSDEYIMSIGCLPDDEWLTTSQSADFYCRDSCGAACDPNRHNHSHSNSNQNIENRADSKWLPHEKRIMISFANTVAHKSSIIPDSIIVDDKFLICAGCKSQLGRIQKNHADLYCFNHISATLTSGAPKKLQFIEKDFFSQSVYLSQLILNSCEAQGSLKLVLRSLDKTPYMLVWLLDSYVVIANGQMAGLKNEEETGDFLNPYPAIKLLYKVFNDQTAGSDPRANGEDTSVGLVDLPLGCCQYLIEMLLRSSLKLPPACRAVGQFFVGFLQIDDHI